MFVNNCLFFNIYLTRQLDYLFISIQKHNTQIGRNMSILDLLDQGKDGQNF